MAMKVNRIDPSYYTVYDEDTKTWSIEHMPMKESAVPYMILEGIEDTDAANAMALLFCLRMIDAEDGRFFLSPEVTEPIQWLDDDDDIGDDDGPTDDDGDFEDDEEEPELDESIPLSVARSNKSVGA